MMGNCEREGELLWRSGSGRGSRALPAAVLGGWPLLLGGRGGQQSRAWGTGAAEQGLGPMRQLPCCPHMAFSEHPPSPAPYKEKGASPSHSTGALLGGGCFQRSFLNEAGSHLLCPVRPPAKSIQKRQCVGWVEDVSKACPFSISSGYRIREIWHTV